MTTVTGSKPKVSAYGSANSRAGGPSARQPEPSSNGPGSAPAGP
ncbi:hypothetical protein ACFQYP_37130 [Nonomuraea antimicrobica]